MIHELESGVTIICDRYTFSGIAFSAAKSLPSLSTIPEDGPTTSTLTYEWCRAPDTNLPSPDLVVFLDVPPEVQRLRGGYGEERYEREDVQRRVRMVFERIASEFHEENKERVGWVHIDAGRTLDEVSEAIWCHIEPFIGGTEEPLGRLWSSIL